jgi:hypothetical protein
VRGSTFYPLTGRHEERVIEVLELLTKEQKKILGWPV